MKKRLFHTLLVTLLFGIIILPANLQEINAEDNFGLSIVYDEKGDKILKDTQNGLVYTQAFLADGTPITLEEYMASLQSGRSLLNQLQINKSTEKTLDNKFTPQNVLDASYFQKKQSWTEAMTPRRASASVDCRGSASPCPISSTETITSTETWSVGLTAGDKNFIKGNAGFTWVSSSASQLSYTLYIPKDRMGYITFAPRYTFVKGDIHYIGCYPITGCQSMGTKTDVWGASPTKTSTGHADGIFALAFEI
ncbi:hypothetical protein [Paenibacillus bouchesdurhonensis]|uniref:hypothetical protein n=1 Tax=Paenibacillus bouchesdurhonensis TaxID=1870990 RepID=UPI000DA5F41A|nr:hypothetical protein [Paenibacillus bouchesdurhonensis]